MNPSLFRLDRRRTGSVLRLRDRMILAQTRHFFLIDHSVCDVLAETESDASAASRLDKIIHRSRVKRIFAVDEFRMQHHVSLLRGTQRDEVRQALPGL